MAKKTTLITKFDTWNAAQQAGKDITAALQEFAAAHGLEITFDKVSKCFHHELFLTLKVNIVEMTKTVNANAAKAADQQEQMLALARAEYIKNAEAYGMKPEWLDQRFFTDESQWGTDYRVRGIKANVGKYNVVVEKLKNEKIYTMPAKNVIERFAVMAKNVAAAKAREAAAAKAKEAATATETAAAGK